MRRASEANPCMSIELPRAHEVVTSVFYEIRIAAENAARVEVSIDGSVWLPCRCGHDYWWYEWSDYRPGDHQIRAQARGSDGEVLGFETRPVVAKFDLTVH